MLDLSVGVGIIISDSEIGFFIQLGSSAVFLLHCRKSTIDDTNEKYLLDSFIKVRFVCI